MNLDYMNDARLMEWIEQRLDSMDLAMDWWSENRVQWYRDAGADVQVGWYLYHRSGVINMGKTLDDVRRFIAKLPPKT